MKIALAGVGRIGVMHAEVLRDHPAVDALLLGDADTDRAREVGAQLGVDAADGIDALFAAKPDGLVVTAATSAHAELVLRAADEGVAVFCEKPLAFDVAGTIDVLEKVNKAGVPLQLGFQRRFDAGFRAAREQVLSGALGRLSLVRSCTLDPAPPHAAYIPQSGGIFRDCAVHDFDAVRWVTGREIVSVQATGSARGAEFFRAAGDVDTGVSVLTLDDGTLAVTEATRYNGAGYDVRLEAHGVDATTVVGLDDRTPIRSAEPGIEWPSGTPYPMFPERFRAAYAAELDAFLEVAAGQSASPCPGEEALTALYVAEAAELSRRENRTVAVEEVTR